MCEPPRDDVPRAGTEVHLLRCVHVVYGPPRRRPQAIPCGHFPRPQEGQDGLVRREHTCLWRCPRSLLIGRLGDGEALRLLRAAAAAQAAWSRRCPRPFNLHCRSCASWAAETTTEVTPPATTRAALKRFAWAPGTEIRAGCYPWAARGCQNRANTTIAILFHLLLPLLVVCFLVLSPSPAKQSISTPPD